MAVFGFVSGCNHYRIFYEYFKNQGFFDMTIINDYFDKDFCEQYEQNTMNIDVSDSYKMFEKYLENGDSVLDVGCGCGRDLIYFHKNGYEVDGLDFSYEMLKIAYKNTKNLSNPHVGLFEIPLTMLKNRYYRNVYHAIWCMGGLVHHNFNKFVGAIECMFNAIRQNGVIFISLKYGTGEKDGYFHYNENDIDMMFSYIKDLYLAEIRVDQDSIRSELQWMNIVLKKY